MFGKPRQVETETELYEAAVRALMRRAYSVYEMKQLLGRRTEDDKFLRTVMDRLKRAKWPTSTASPANKAVPASALEVMGEWHAGALELSRRKFLSSTLWGCCIRPSCQRSR